MKDKASFFGEFFASHIIGISLRLKAIIISESKVFALAKKVVAVQEGLDEIIELIEDQ